MRRAPLAAVAGALALGLAAGRTSAQPPALTLTQLTWVDRTGRPLSTIGPLADHGNIELSPDGARVAAAVLDRRRGTRDIWIYDQDGSQTRFTSEAADENWAIWSPDGSRLALNFFDTDRLVLLERPARGGSPATELFNDEKGKWPVSWSPDGSRILFVTNHERTGNDIWVLPLNAAEKPYPFSDTRAAENWAAFSPDGRFVAYSSTAPTGRADVYIAPIPGDGRMWRVSADGGTQARWRRQNELLYVDFEGRVIAATLAFPGDDIVVTDLSPLFTLTYPYGSYHAFDVTNDGTKILVNTLVVSPNRPTLSVSNQVR